MTSINEGLIQEIHVTKDYSIFKRLVGNRPVLPKKVTHLTNSFKANGNLTPQNPIIVNENYEVIDGQHRIAALEQLGWPVYYVIQKNATAHDMYIHNLYRTNWRTIDYIISYAEQNKPDYVRALKVINDFPNLKVTSVVPILFIHSKKYASVYVQIARGDAEFPKERETVVVPVLKMINDCLELMPIKRQNLPFRALKLITNNVEYDHQRMTSKLVKYGDQIKEYGTIEDWLRQLETIYNKGLADDKRVALF